MEEPLIQRLNALAKEIASGNYDHAKADDLFRIAGGGQVPGKLADLAESFGMMMVKVEAREFQLTLTNQELVQAQEKLRAYAEHLEALVEERTRDLANANRELQVLANLDGLTRVANRRHFDEILANELARDATPIALVLLDVDCFKLYNDTYGHQAGDACLQKVAAALKDAVADEGGTAARFGGEEFAAVLPGHEMESARRIASLVQLNLREMAITHANSSAAKWVSASIGIAVSEPGDSDRSPTSLIARADQCLYRAKAEGRNRIVAISSTINDRGPR